MAILLQLHASPTQIVFSPPSADHSRKCNVSPTSYPYFFVLTRKRRKLLLAIARASKITASKSSPISSSNGCQMVEFLPLLLFQELGFNRDDTEVLFEKNPILRFTSAQAVREKIASFRSLGLSEFSLWRLITRRPEILSAGEVEEFLDFVRENLKGIEPRKLERLLIIREPRFLVGFGEKVEVVVENGIPKEKLVEFFNRINLNVFCRRDAKEIEKHFIFFNRYDPNVICRRPTLLNLDLEKQIIPRIAFFRELGGDEETFRVLLRKFPRILAHSVELLQDHRNFWESIGLNGDEIFKIIKVYPGVLGVSKERKLKPRVEFLRECGLDVADIYRFLSRAPLFLSLSFRDNLCKKLTFLMKLGYKEKKRELAYALGAVTRSSCENMQLVIGLFLNYGFSMEDVFFMSMKHPQVLQYNHKSLEKKMDYLIEEMGREIGELLAFPAFLGYKLDERIKPRYEVKKETFREGMSLNKLLTVSTEAFLKKVPSGIE